MNLENININEDIEIDDGTNKSIISEEQEVVSKASDCLVKWIIVNQHSFTIVEESAFADLIYALQPDAKLISADTVKRKIMDLYESNINKVKESFKNITGKISFTIDIWTSPSAKSFLSLTAHYIDDDWKLNNVLVDFIQIFGKHMGENIKNAFMLGINKLSIQNKLRILLNKIHHFSQRQEKLSFNCELHDNEWSELEKVELFFEKFKEITVLMSSSLYPTLSMLIFLYNALIDHMEDYISEGEEENTREDENESEDEIGNDNEESTIKKAAMNCRVKLLHYYNKTNDAYIIVTILDLKLKMKYYNDEIFLNVYNTTYSNSNSSSTLSNSLNNEYKNSIILKVFKQKRTQEIDEFQAYLLSPICDKSIDSLQWWKINQSQFFRLAKMAIDYLAIPSTSVPSKECFLISKNLITDKRNKLAGKTIRSYMCLKSWISGSLSDLFE
ncbi:zinc finger BED domain-containing protein RICESLEEPER 2-like [Rhizophagus clarus]|uniref:Zinc finger BED domain-containing protein RICESLEEPER 2-like n=1 Tax=Rhizophagus clarus TaxID=94130 RepID=A0A8H3QBI7_9GLOM|nr:zinc finger BED domain-containing protein RICESLEEPER 2-like [Rhizophagus clarus]